MRLDYYHTGNSKQEFFSVDRVRIEPLPWPGDMSKTIDDSNLGKYFFEVRDQATKRILTLAVSLRSSASGKLRMKLRR